jgi:hypothetical protein
VHLLKTFIRNLIEDARYRKPQVLLVVFHSFGGQAPSRSVSAIVYCEWLLLNRSGPCVSYVELIGCICWYEVKVNTGHHKVSCYSLGISFLVSIYLFLKIQSVNKPKCMLQQNSS